MNKRKWGSSINSNREAKKVKIDFEEIINLNKNPKGRSRTIEENKLFIQSMAYFQKNKMSLDAAAKECVAMFGGSYDTYKSLWNYYINTGDLNISDTHLTRGPSACKHLGICDIDDEYINSIIEFAFEYTVANHSGFSIPDLLSFFETQHNIVLSQSTIQYLLQEYNFSWSQQQVYYGNEYQQDRIQEMKRFLLQYSHALNLEQKNSHVIVATDESWANTGTSFENSWIHICNNENSSECIVCSKFIKLANGDAKVSIQKPNTGKRNVFIHAITRNGLLTDFEDNKSNELLYIQPSFQELENLQLKINTCEYIIECGNDNSRDYHEEMNFQKYVQYFENRLIESCNNLLQNKKAIIFLDQCPFHMVSNGFPLSSDNKHEISKYYEKHNIQSITLRRYDKNCNLGDILTFESSKFDCKPKLTNPELGGPSKDELYLYLFMYLKLKKPNALEPIVCQIAKKHNHLVLFSCPYNPSDMPSEYLNSYVKCNVKQCYKKNRTIMQLKTDIRNGFYGGQIKNIRYHNCVNSHMTNGWFKKCESNMNTEILKLLQINDKNINNLWSENSEISLFMPWTRIPKTQKILRKLSKKFVIVIDNINQNFV